MKPFDLGVMFRCVNPPEMLIPFVQRAEQCGFDETWVVEDCFYAGGIASASVALANTQHMKIGLGIMPAVVRNPAFAAMEIAALARLFPHRFLPGLGHGVGTWMKQVGAFPTSQLAALEEVTLTIRALLRGVDVDFHGKHVDLSHVKLNFPPNNVPPVSLGVRSIKSLQLSGRSADGTILAEYGSPAYVRWAVEQIQAGQRAVGNEGDPHRVTVYTFCVVDADHDVAVQKLRPQVADAIASGNLTAYLEPLGIADEAKRLVETTNRVDLPQAIPTEWITQLAVVGTPSDCRDSIRQLVESGADSVILVPLEDDMQTLSSYADALLPMRAQRD